ncbi:MAG: class II aldolase/adducin family protein [Desulfobacterales bacterium]|nr:class II aldolase/adducin family protein [Desulfobacterales bacterium]
MERLIHKFSEKLIQAGLAEESGPNAPLIAGLDHTLTWNREAAETQILDPLFDMLNINSLVFFRPTRPHDALIGHLARRALASGENTIHPRDCETRTFLHDLPVVDRFDPQVLARALTRRKSVIIMPGEGTDFQGPAILAHGSVSPEQGFVVTSSICFACFVKFFTDYLEALQRGEVDGDAHDIFNIVRPELEREAPPRPQLNPGPFKTEEEVYRAIIQAGKATVDLGLVDSYFGNISFCQEKTLYISQTGSSLDELAGCIDPVPLDGSTSAGLTASSELTAHLETIAKTHCQAILHGHPKFSVISSMICPPGEKDQCPDRDQCHLRCPKKRFAGAIPIVPGEVGTGPHGLCNTLPAAFVHSKGVIVYGHGLFTRGNQDFIQAFNHLYDMENQCRSDYFKQIDELEKK